MVAITSDIIDRLRHGGKYNFTAQFEAYIDAKVFLALLANGVYVRAYWTLLY